jgi:hypothetical protein
MVGRKPALSAGTFKTRRMRRRARGEQLPKGDTWEHHAQGGRSFFRNGRVLTARLQIGGHTWQWPLKGIAEEDRAEALMAPVRVARERLQQAAVEALDCELETIAADDAAVALAGARAQLARAILGAGGPEKAAEFVRKGPQQRGGMAKVSASDRHADPSELLLQDRSPTARETNGVRAVAPRRHARRSPAVERARGALKELYPKGVPDQVLEPNANLCRRVGEKLRQAGLLGVSDDTILRAAGRRK